MKKEADKLKYYGQEPQDRINSKIKEIEETLNREIKIKQERELEIRAQQEAEIIRVQQERAREEFKRNQLEKEREQKAAEELSRRTLGQLRRFERERTTRAFEGVPL